MPGCACMVVNTWERLRPVEAQLTEDFVASYAGDPPPKIVNHLSKSVSDLDLEQGGFNLAI